MTTALVIEEDRGTYVENHHPHNGYYAGDFSTARPASPSTGYRPPAEVATLRMTVRMATGCRTTLTM